MIGSILLGISYGLLLSVLTGPIFFNILQVSVERGFRAGTALVAGQWLSDFIFIAIAFWGLSYLKELEENQAFKGELTLYLGVAGSIFLTILGVILFASKTKNENTQQAVSKKSFLGLFLQGFFINTLTPFPVFFWISLMSTTIDDDYYTNATRLALAISVMFVVIATDLLKVYLAKKIRRFLTPKAIINVRKGAGIALMLSGILLLIRVTILA